ncbi:MAG: type II secretion system protein J [Phycisphaerae bacterium]
MRDLRLSNDSRHGRVALVEGNAETATRSGRGGFTLLEILLAIVLIVGVLGGVFGLYAYASDFRETLNEESQRVSQRRAVMARLTDELRATVAEPWLREDPDSEGDLMLQFGLVGETDEDMYYCTLRLVCARVPGPAAWVERNITEKPVEPESDLMVVTYALRVDPESGQVEGLQRTEQKLLASLPETPGRTTLVDPRARFFQVRYWSASDSDWVYEWPEGGLPMAVEIVISDELPEDMNDLPSSYARRVVYLPAGKTPLRGQIIRGLSPGGSR